MADITIPCLLGRALVDRIAAWTTNRLAPLPDVPVPAVRPVAPAAGEQEQSR